MIGCTFCPVRNRDQARFTTRLPVAPLLTSGDGEYTGSWSGPLREGRTVVWGACAAHVAELESVMRAVRPVVRVPHPRGTVQLR